MEYGVSAVVTKANHDSTTDTDAIVLANLTRKLQAISPHIVLDPMDKEPLPYYANEDGHLIHNEPCYQYTMTGETLEVVWV